MQLSEETGFLERVARYRQEFRSIRAAAISEERERRHANGEVYIAGGWVPRLEAGKVVRGLQRRELFGFCEIVIWVAVLLGAAWGLCWLFGFLLLPG